MSAELAPHRRATAARADVQHFDMFPKITKRRELFIPYVVHIKRNKKNTRELVRPCRSGFQTRKMHANARDFFLFFTFSLFLQKYMVCSKIAKLYI
jgi:hypothetical protein